MKEKLALILISLDECFAKEGFSGGGHKVTKHLVLGLAESKKFDIDIYCYKSAVQNLDGINSINILNKKTFKSDLKEKLKQNKYDYILSSDILLPFANNLVHSNSSKHKTKNGKNKLMQFILKFYNAKKIKNQEKNIAKNKALFAVSESLKNDYLINFNLDAKKVFACIPAVDNYSEFEAPEKREYFTIGSMAGGGLNKGGYLLLFALKILPSDTKLKARIIFPKFHKSRFYSFMINLLGLQKKIELLPKQSNMNEFYNSIDCYVLPSLNEAFGLVVTEAASNFKPSIVSSTTGVRELIEDGQNGFIFDRAKKPVKNLVKKLSEVCELYFNQYNKFVEISKNANEITKKLDWKNFVDTIINNMVKEAESID